jgi:phosphoglycolate phosphatase-like HAD superfamily hydrolase
LLEGCELSHVFEAVVAGDEVSRPKPCSEGLLMVCDHLGLAPASVVYVGDMQADIDCAREAGCVAVLAGWAAEPDQVSGAAFVAPTPSALVELVNAQGHGCPDGPFL